MTWWVRAKTGFTIVELLIVVVVIAILVLITIITYNGIQQRALVTSIQSNLAHITRKLEVEKISLGGTYPVTLPSDLAQSGTFYEYTAATNDYCVVQASGSITYFVTSRSTQPTLGTCTGLIGWWPLNGDTKDLAMGNDGINNGGASTANKSGAADTAWNLPGDATTRYIATPLVFSPASFTASVWIRADGGGPSSFSSILSNTRDCCNTFTGFQLDYNRTTRTVNSRLWTGGGGPTTNTALVAGVVLNQWQLITTTYDGAKTNLYVDGQLAASSLYTLIGPLASTILPMKIGGGGWTTSGYSFGGIIDDVRIYSRPLSDIEISYLYATGPQ